MVLLLFKNRVFDVRVFICNGFPWPMFTQPKLRETASSVQISVENIKKV